MDQHRNRVHNIIIRYIRYDKNSQFLITKQLQTLSPVTIGSLLPLHRHSVVVERPHQPGRVRLSGQLLISKVHKRVQQVGIGGRPWHIMLKN